MKLLSEFFIDDDTKTAQIFLDEGQYIVKLIDKLKLNMDVEYAVTSETYAENVAEDWVS